MAKLHFLYSVMNAGKTTHLLQVRYNYIENGGHVLLFTSLIDDRRSDSSRSRFSSPGIPKMYSTCSASRALTKRSLAFNRVPKVAHCGDCSAVCGCDR